MYAPISGRLRSRDKSERSWSLSFQIKVRSSIADTPIDWMLQIHCKTNVNDPFVNPWFDFPSECRASGKFLGRTRNVRLIDETAFPFLDPNQSFGALEAKAKSKRANSRLRSLKPNGAYPARKTFGLTQPPENHSTETKAVIGH